MREPGSDQLQITPFSGDHALIQSLIHGAMELGLQPGDLQAILETASPAVVAALSEHFGAEHGPAVIKAMADNLRGNSRLDNINNDEDSQSV